MENIDLNLDKITAEFLRIKNLGFIENKRPNNRDGGIGNTFEDLLGVKENNKTDPDFEGFEIKSKRNLNGSYLSLFCKSPSFPKGANKYLKDTFGEIRQEGVSKEKILYASVFGHRESQIYNKYLMNLKVDKENFCLRLIIKDLNRNTLSENVFWSNEDLDRASKKINKLFVVYATEQKENGLIKFHYTEAEVFIGFNLQSFMNFIETGNIMFDLRMGEYKSGRNKGKPHDHGSGFRIKKENLSGLFDSVLIMQREAN